MMNKEAAASDLRQEAILRWTAKRKSAVVLSILKGETSIAETARAHSLTVAEIERWKEAFLSGAENALRSAPKDEESAKEEHIKRLERKVGRMTLEMDIMREAMRPYRPFPEKISDE